jgi:isocitrate/isopropylmalate dehydrogenase
MNSIRSRLQAEQNIMPDQIQKRSCYRIASIPGDGIGPEVIEAAETVVNCAAKAIGFDVEIQRFPWGTDFYKMTGSYIPDDGLAVLKQYDAILFGAVGSPGMCCCLGISISY